jgi:DNA-binding transcriptional MerR regulator
MTATLRIGQLAETTGLTVRAIRHYESVGLLTPAGRSESGYRLYRAEEAERLYAVVLLRQFGFSLGEIGAVLDDDGADLAELVRRHLVELEERSARLGELRVHLRRLKRTLGSSRSLPLPVLCDLVRLTMQTKPPRFLADEPATLSTLADPASQQILHHLYLRGPATAASLARALGEERATIEKQLDRLSAHGLIELDTDRSTAKTPRWRAVADDLRLPLEGRTAETDAVARSWFEPSLQALAQFVSVGDPWANSSTLSHSLTHLTRGELERFGTEYRALLGRYARPADDAPRDARPTVAMLFAFPRAAD